MIMFIILLVNLIIYADYNKILCGLWCCYFITLLCNEIYFFQAFQNILPDRSKLSFDKLVEFLELFLLLMEFSENHFGDLYDNTVSCVFVYLLVSVFILIQVLRINVV